MHLPVFSNVPDTMPILKVNPPPELHLFIGVTNSLFNELQRRWPDACTWIKRCNVQRHAMHGGTFHGNSCKQLLRNIDILRPICPLNCLPICECFESFRAVVQACIGEELKIRLSRRRLMFSSEIFYRRKSTLPSKYICSHVSCEGVLPSNEFFIGSCQRTSIRKCAS